LTRDTINRATSALVIRFR